MKLTRTILTAAVVVAAAGTAFADDAELQDKYEKKIAKQFVADGGWVLDYDEARQRAKAEDKLIFIYFTRSYSP